MVFDKGTYLIWWNLPDFLPFTNFQKVMSKFMSRVPFPSQIFVVDKIVEKWVDFVIKSSKTTLEDKGGKISYDIEKRVEYKNGGPIVSYILFRKVIGETVSVDLQDNLLSLTINARSCSYLLNLLNKDILVNMDILDKALSQMITKLKYCIFSEDISKIFVSFIRDVCRGLSLRSVGGVYIVSHRKVGIVNSCKENLFNEFGMSFFIRGEILDEEEIVKNIEEELEALFKEKISDLREAKRPKTQNKLFTALQDIRMAWYPLSVQILERVIKEEQDKIMQTYIGKLVQRLVNNDTML